MVYKITSYSLRKAQENNLTIKPSTKKNKKIDVYKNGKFIVSIGDVRYKDYPTYILNNGKKYADERRKLYYIRHNINSSKYSADNLAKLILW
jgi:hypothetical protein